MSIDITNNIDVELDVLDVTQSKNNNSVSTPDQYVKVEESESPVEVTKKEYTVIGDGLYASVTAEEAPPWLLGLIDEVVDSAVASGMVDYDLLTQDVRSAIDALDVASNTYVEQINIDATINNIITTRLTTLNATLENTYATKTELTTAVVNADSALVQQVNNLTTSFNDELSSQITGVQQAFANADSAIADDITQLTATFDDQEANLSAAADAITGLQTYVGLNESSSPNGTGLLGRTFTLENQVDGKIEYYFYDSYTDITGAANEGVALSIIDNEWFYNPAYNGNVVYFKDTQNGYWYQSSTDTWLTITDTSIYQALQEASNAQASADGRVSQFYAWYDVANNIPADFDILAADGTTVVETIVADNFKYWYNTNGYLYYYTGTNWAPYLSVEEGDILSAFDIDTRDVTVYTYNGTSWEKSGPTGTISSSKFFVDLENNVTGPGGHVATSLTNLQTTSEAYADNVGAGVENKFAYNSEVVLNGSHYTSGFGLNSSGITQDPSADGTSGNAYDSEFWVNAERFVLKSPSYPSIEASFTVTDTGISLGVEHTEATRNEPRGTYSSTVNYFLGDIVTYNNSSYVATQASINQTPSDTSAYWQLLAKQGSTPLLFEWTGNTSWPTSTTEASALEYQFESSFSGSTAIRVLAYDAEGGVRLKLNNGTEIPFTRTLGDNTQEWYEFPLDNLVAGTNTLKFWSTTADGGSIKAIEVAFVGAKGIDGISFTGTTEYYAKSSNGTTAPAIGTTDPWFTTPPTLDATNKYLWNYNVISKSNGTSDDSTPTIVAQYVKDGKGISSITEKYQAGSSGTTAPTGIWSSTLPSLTDTNKYLWNQTTIAYTEGTDTVITTIIAIKGTDGSAADNYKEIALYQNASSVPTSVPTNAQGFTASSGAAAASGSWATTIGTLGSGEKTYRINITLRQPNGTGDWAAVDSEWNGPVQITGLDGQPGNSADTYKEIFLYANSTSQPSAPTLTNSYNASTGIAQAVTGWTISPSDPSSGSYTYRSSITLVQTESTGNWSNSDSVWGSPVRLTGDLGNPGAAGPRGTAVLTYSADYSSTVPASMTNTQLATAWNAAASVEYDTEIAGDTLVITNTNTASGWTHIFEYNGSSWSASNTFVVNGNQIVEGTLVVNGSQIIEGTLNANRVGSGAFFTTTLSVATVASGYSGTVMDQNGIRVYDNGVLRVKLGKL